MLQLLRWCLSNYCCLCCCPQQLLLQQVPAAYAAFAVAAVGLAVQGCQWLLQLLLALLLAV
jgi:hypothetical protein